MISNKYYIKMIKPILGLIICLNIGPVFGASINHSIKEKSIDILANPIFDLSDNGRDLIPTSCDSFKAKIVILKLPDCGTNNGSAMIKVEGATGEITYSSGNSPQLNNLGAGSQWVMVSDEAGCSTKLDFELTPKGCCTLAASAEIMQHPTCEGNGMNGAACIKVTGAKGQVRYSWGSQSCYDNLTAGTQVVIVSDSICSVSVVVKLNDTNPSPCVQPPPCTLSAVAIINQHPTCEGDSRDGSACIEVTGAQGPIRYSWGSQACYDNLTPGTRMVVVSDNICSVQVPVVLDLVNPADCPPTPCTLSASAIINKHPTCEGEGKDGSVCIQVTGAQGPISYSWGPQACYDNLTPGIRIVTVSDGICSVNVRVELAETDPNPCPSDCLDFKAKIVINKLPECNKDNGSATVMVQGATGKLTYSWGDHPRMDNLSAGNHWVMVSDEGGCSAKLDFTLTGESCCTLAATVNINKQPTCDGKEMDGAACIVVTGAQGPITYSWGEQNCRNDLSPGTQIVTVSDSLCSVDVEVTLNKVDSICDPVVCNLKITNVEGFSPDCEVLNGYAIISTSRVVGPLTYTWADGFVSMDSIRENLGAGEYAVTISDELTGCKDSTNFILIEPDPCCFTETAEIMNPDCNIDNGRVIFTISNAVGTITFNWSDGLVTTNPVRGNMAAGEYIVIISEEGALFCNDTVNITLLSPFDCPCPLVGGFEIIKKPDCENANGEVAITHKGATSAITYCWSGSTISDTTLTDSIRTGLMAGDYQVIIKQDNTCTDSIDFTIDKQSAPELMVTPEVICPTKTGRVDYSIIGCFAGPVSVQLFDKDNMLIESNLNDEVGQGNFTNLPPGNYTITVSTEDGQSIGEENFNIESFPEIMVTETVSNACNTKGSIQLEVAGGNENYTFNWTNVDGVNNTADIFDLESGTYQVVIIDTRNNCQITKEFPITQGENPIIMADRERINCVNDSLQLLVTNTRPTIDTLEYVWKFSPNLMNTGDTIQNPIVFTDSIIQAVKATVIATNQFGCKDTSTTSIIIDGPPRRPFDFDFEQACDANTLSFESDQFISNVLMWDFGDPTTNSDTSTQAMADYTYPETGMYVVTVSIRPNYTCRRDKFEPITKEVIVKEAMSITVDFDIEDLTPCDSLAEIKFFNDSEIDGGIIDSFVWKINGIAYPNEKEPIIEIVRPTDLIVDLEVFDSSMCSSNLTDTIPFEELPRTIFDTAVCVGTMVTLGDEDPSTTYTWEANDYFNSNDQNPMIVLEKSETFIATLEQSGQCEIIENNFLVSDTSNLSPFTLFADADVIAFGEETDISVTPTLPVGYSVQSTTLNFTDNGEATDSPEETMDYFATIKDEVGCQVNRAVRVIVNCRPNGLFFPNAFSPNGDGNNDVLFVRGVDNLVSMKLAIYNRWGQKVFESNDPENGWDGTFKGEPVCADVYGYYLTITCPAGPQIMQGNVTVLK